LPLSELCSASNVCILWKFIAETEVNKRVKAGLSAKKGVLIIVREPLHIRVTDDILKEGPPFPTSLSPDRLFFGQPWGLDIVKFYPKAVKSILFIFPDVRGNEISKTSFSFCSVFQVNAGFADSGMSRGNGTDGPFKDFETHFSRFEVTRVTYCESTRSQPYYSDVTSFLRKTKMFSFTPSFLQRQIKPRDFSSQGKGNWGFWCLVPALELVPRVETGIREVYD
jgi:hypothetical protein